MDKPLAKVEQYTIAAWTPERDGKGTPEAVMIAFDVAGLPYQLAIRLKSKEAVNKFIAALERTRNEVWM